MAVDRSRVGHEIAISQKRSNFRQIPLNILTLSAPRVCSFVYSAKYASRSEMFNCRRKKVSKPFLRDEVVLAQTFLYGFAFVAYVVGSFICSAKYATASEIMTVTDRQTDRQTHRTSTVTLAHATNNVFLLPFKHLIVLLRRSFTGL